MQALSKHGTTQVTYTNGVCYLFTFKLTIRRRNRLFSQGPKKDFRVSIIAYGTYIFIQL